MDEVRDIIMNVALKHNDSGEASLSRLARLILQELKENNYEVVKSNSVLGGVINIDCKDCGDRGVLYDENGNTTNCPCHYL